MEQGNESTSARDRVAALATEGKEHRFPVALESMLAGVWVSRRVWGIGRAVRVVFRETPLEVPAGLVVDGEFADRQPAALNELPSFDAVDVAGGTLQHGWLPTPADLFADDWYIPRA